MLNKVSLYAPIEKTDEEQRMVYGYASTEALDSQGEVVKIDALKAAITDYMKFANIREMHQPSAVGKAKKAQIDNKGLYICAKVVDNNAWLKVKEGVYSGFSIGGRVIEQVDNEITNLRLAEISLVDRPANPEATFDVWKMEKIEGEDAKEEVVEEPKEEVKKDVFGASYLVDLATRIAVFIEGEKYNKEDTKDLERALKSVKAALVDEVKEPEYFESMNDEDVMPVEDAVEYAEKTLDLKKADEDVIEVEKDIEPAKDVVVEDVKEEVEEEKPELKEEVKETEEETKETETEEVVEEVKEEEVVEEPKETAEKTTMEKVAEIIMQAQMPDNDMIAAMLKESNVEPTQKAIDAARWELAGKVIAVVEKSINDNKEQIVEVAKEDIEKTDKPKEAVKHQWDEVKFAVNKFGKVLKEEINKSTTAEAPKLPQSEVSPVAPNEQVTQALALLNQAVQLLASQGVGGQMTPSEENKERNGVNTGTGEVTSAPHVKAEETEDLTKLEDKINNLTKQIEELSKQPMPVKIMTGYTTVNKFETNNVSEELQKKEDRANELHELMKAEPNNEAYKKEAETLTYEIMRLKRQIPS